MTLREIRSVRWVHLVSGLDEYDGRDGRATPCGAATSISGYTEWLGGPELQLTLGWDWIVDLTCECPSWRRSGTPRTNVLLTDVFGRDCDYHLNLATLGELVDALAWQDEARSAIAMRYAA
jgi:hypothetical protein